MATKMKKLRVMPDDMEEIPKVQWIKKNKMQKNPNIILLYVKQ